MLVRDERAGMLVHLQVRQHQRALSYMPRSLGELAKCEDGLLTELPQGGYVEDRLPVIEKAGFSRRWQAVLDSYAELLSDAEQGLEALRRATFLVWYSWNEPYFLTGIQPFEEASVRRVLGYLDHHLASAQPDPELLAMLRGYGPGLPFDQHPALPGLTAFMTSLSGPNSPGRPLASMVGRGAMGAYWRSRRDAA